MKQKRIRTNERSYNVKLLVEKTEKGGKSDVPMALIKNNTKQSEEEVSETIIKLRMEFMTVDNIFVPLCAHGVCFEEQEKILLYYSNEYVLIEN